MSLDVSGALSVARSHLPSFSTTVSTVAKVATFAAPFIICVALAEANPTNRDPLASTIAQNVADLGEEVAELRAMQGVTNTVIQTLCENLSETAAGVLQQACQVFLTNDII